MSALDDDILGPSLAERTAAAKVAANLPAREFAIAGDAYEGADRYDASLALWNPGLDSADADLLPSKGIMDARVRDRLRNDAYVSGGETLHKDNIVGAMFLLNAKPATKVLFGKDDPVWEEEFQEEVETKFTLYAESPDCWVDASRHDTLTDMVRLGVGVSVSGGEILAGAEWMPNDGRPFRTALQMVDADRLSTPYDKMNDNNIRGGVAQDAYGAAVGYYIQQAHPSDWADPNRYKWKYVPARKPWGRRQILHIYDRKRAAQSRGIAEMVAALKELKITKRFRDVVLQNAVVNATYAASIESELPTEAVFERLGGAKLTDAGIADAISAFATGYLSTIDKFGNASKNLKIDGARIPHLLPGTKLQLRPAGQGGPLGTDFEQSLLRYIAAILGVSYEQLSRDYTQTNYSSARAAMVETWKFMQARKRKFADGLAGGSYRLWLEEAINKKLITSLPRNAPSWYEGQNADAYTACEWIGASRGQIDELKETQAAVLRLNNNLTTHEYEIARAFGADWRRVFRQAQREKKMREAFGLVSDAIINGSGMRPTAESSGGANNGN